MPKVAEAIFMVDISYDPVADALYIKFSNEKIKESDEISDGVILDL